MTDDKYGIVDTDTAEVYIDSTPPDVHITQPKKRMLYFLGEDIGNLLFKTRIIGSIVVKADGWDNL